MVEGLQVISGLVLLILGGNMLLKGAVGLSMRLHIPRIIIGMTVVSFATSAPELIVSAKAALDGFPDLALGNVIGSNIANLGLVLAVTLLIGHLDVRRSFYFTDWPMMMAASLVFYVFLILDQQLSRAEGAIMLGLLFAFLVYLLRFQKQAVVDVPSDTPALKPLYLVLTHLALGGVALWGGSELLVAGAVGLAQIFGVSERVIGITVVSVGTSIPELAASVIAMVRKEKAISVGNLIGSNIFNLLAVLGITALIAPIATSDPAILEQDVYWMLGIALLILPLVFIPKGLRMGWRDGVVLLLVYGGFLYTTLI
ncbi:calcium/sodium antiporter [Robiginitalea sediminis]|uniref:calcium/sodium antiporter n=1 Tax=Robiginitalea sediminis TaxID=1982593 RepID=UPI000B4ACDAC|nr:calcium/sodium antiporter [Robiginitalea sediminis]